MRTTHASARDVGTSRYLCTSLRAPMMANGAPPLPQRSRVCPRIGRSCLDSFLSLDKRQATQLFFHMIRSFRHRGLKALYEGRSERRVSPQHVVRLRDILAVLDRSRKPDDMNLPGFRLHPLKGVLKGHWAVWVSGNWRVTFRFEAGDAYDVDYLDYH